MQAEGLGEQPAGDPDGEDRSEDSGRRRREAADEGGLKGRRHAAARIGQDDQRDALPDRHRREGDDDRRQAEQCHHRAIGEPCGQSDGERRRQAQRRVARRDQRHHGAGNAGDRPQRQVDAARQHDEELAKGDKRQGHGVDAERPEIEGREAVLQADENGEQGGKDQHRPAVAEKGASSRRCGHRRLRSGPPGSRRARCGRR